MATIPDGTYSIELPFGAGAITDAGEGRYLTLLPPGSLGPENHKVRICLVPREPKSPSSDRHRSKFSMIQAKATHSSSQVRESSLPTLTNPE